MTDENSIKIHQSNTCNLRDELLSLSTGERAARLGDLIRNRLAQTMGIDAAEIDDDTPFQVFKREWKFTPDLHGILIFHSVIKDVIENALERSFYVYELLLHPRETGMLNTIRRLTTYLAEDMEIPAPSGTFTDPHEGANWAWDLPKSLPEGATRNPPVIFPLSSPRAGSTIFRIMLEGHPDLFAPPELFLLMFESMAERRKQIDANGYYWFPIGLSQALEMEGFTPVAAAQRLQQLEADNVPIQQVYQMSQKLIGDRILVDRTPAYPFHPAWLQRAEQLFDGAKYVHLTRHPYPVIESTVRMRFHKTLLGNHVGFWDENPWIFAEKMWAVSYSNNIAFLKTVPQNRQHTVRYEDLVTNTESVMRGVCAFLEIPFHPAVLDPYKGERRQDGMGDPNVKVRRQVDPALATAWQKNRPPLQLNAFSQRIAQELGYEL